MLPNDHATVSQSDVARHLGLSTSTVSLVLRGDPRVSEATRQRVLRAVDQLGYRRDAHLEARSLRARRSGRPVRFNAVGLLWRGEHFSIIDRSYHRAMFEAVVDACWHRDQLLTLMSAAWDVGRLQAAAARLDGLVVMPAHQKAIDLARTCHRSVITIMGAGPAMSGAADVSIDHERAIELAFNHLRQFGHRRIGYIGPETAGPVAKKRYEAYRRCMREAIGQDQSLPVVNNLRMHGTDGGHEGFERLFAATGAAKIPTGVVVYNDMMAIGVLQAATAKGLRVPEDLSIVSIDDISEAAQTDPPLTTVHVDARTIGQRAIDYLIESAGQSHPEARALSVDVKLVSRASVARPKAVAA